MRYSDEQMRRLATYGTIEGVWQVEASFGHIDGPVIYLTNGDNMDGSKIEPKRDAYRQVADWLMAENIQKIVVYDNGDLVQTITVHGKSGLIDRELAEQYATRLLDFYGGPEEDRWTGFTAKIVTYGSGSDLGPFTTVPKEAALQRFRDMADNKPPATIQGVRFVLKSVALVEETPTSGYVKAEYVREEAQSGSGERAE